MEFEQLIKQTSKLCICFRLLFYSCLPIFVVPSFFKWDFILLLIVFMILSCIFDRIVLNLEGIFSFYYETLQFSEFGFYMYTKMKDIKR